MPVPLRTLKVRPNPWIGHDTISRIGLPVGRVAVEQPPGGFDPRFVGARIKEARLVSSAPKGAPLAQDDHDLEIEYVTEPVDVANTPYYRRRVITGELIAADRASFVAAGGAPRDFEDHQKHLAARREEAIRAFDERNGEGAFKALNDQRAADDLAREAAAKEAAAPATPEAPKTEAKKGSDQ